MKYHESLKDQPANCGPATKLLAHFWLIFQKRKRAIQLRRQTAPTDLGATTCSLRACCSPTTVWGTRVSSCSSTLCRQRSLSALPWSQLPLLPRQKTTRSRPWTLEDLARHISLAQGAGPWIDAFSDRYLRFEKLDPLVKSYTLKPGSEP